MKKIGFSLIMIIVLLGGLTLTGCQDQENSSQVELEKVTVILDWYPNTNHTGLYAAKELGYYEEQGLDVKIIQPSSAGADQLVATNVGQFGVSYQEGVTYARSQGIPIKSIAAIIQHNTSGFASLAEAGIVSPADFVGKTYGGWGSPAEAAILNSLLTPYGQTIEAIDMVDIGSADFFAAVAGEIDFTWIFYGWDGVAAELRDVDINAVMLKDQNQALDYYTPVLITNEELIAARPELVEAFMAATAAGYDYAIAEPEAASLFLLKNAPELEEDLVKASQAWLADKYQDDANYWGYQDLEVWQNYYEWMQSYGLIEAGVDMETAFTNEFLPGN